MPNGMEQAGIEAVIRNLSQFKAGAKEMDDAIGNIGITATKTQQPVSRLSRYIDELGQTAGSATLVFGGLAAAGGALITKIALLAARNQELDIALEVVAKTMGVSTETVKKQEEKLKDLGITTQQARQSMLLFMQGELELTDITKLASAARDLAVIGMKDTSATMTDLTEAILTQFPIRLREYGITKNLTQIYEEYAKEVLKAGAAVSTTTVDNSADMATLGREMALLQDKIKLNNEELALQIGYWGEDDLRVKKHKHTIEGMNISLSKMQERYNELAGGHGKVITTSKELSVELTEQQKKQAFLHAILKEGAKVFGIYDAAMELPSKRLRSFPRYIEEFFNALGQYFLEPMGIAVHLVGDFLEGLQNLPPEIMKNIASFIGMGTAMAGTLAGFAGFVMLIGPKATELGMIFTGPLAQAMTFLLNPISLLVIALGALVGAFVFDVGGIRTKTMPALKELAGVFQEKVLPVLEKVVGGFKSVLDAIMSLVKGDVQGAMLNLATAIRKVFGIEAGLQFYDFLKSFMPRIDELRAAFQATFEGIRQIVWSVIGGIVESVGTAWATISQWTQENWGTIQAFITTVLDWIRSFVELTIANVTEIFQSAWTIIREWTEENWPLIQKTIKTVLTYIMNIVAWIMAAVSAIWRDYGQGMLEFAQTIWDMIKVAIETVITVILGIIKTVMLLLQRDWRGAWEEIRNVARTLWEGIKTIVGLAIGKVRDILESVMGAIGRGWERAWEAMRKAMNEKLTEIKKRVGEWLGEIKQKIIDFKDSIMAAGRTLMMGLLEGMKEKADAIIAWILELLRSMKQAIKDFFGFKCPEPSRLMMQFGRQVIEGFIEGLEQMRPALEAQMRMTLAPAIQMASPAAIPSPVLVQAGHTYNFNLSANYAQVQSPASILDDLTAMQMLAAARG